MTGWVVTEHTVSCELKCPGYESRVTFPLGSDAREGLIAWFEMQLAYLAREVEARGQS